MQAIHLSIDLTDIEKRCHREWGFYASDWAQVEANTLTAAHELKNRNIETVYIGYDSVFVPFESGVGYFKDTPKETSDAMRDDKSLEFTLSMAPDTLVAYKRGYSAYKETAIAEWVERQGIKEIFISGVVEMDSLFRVNKRCVSETARDLSEAGYRVTIVAEATHRGIKGSVDYLSLEKRKRNHSLLGVSVTPLEEILARLDAPAEPKEPAKMLSLDWARHIWRNKGLAPGEH